MYAAKESKGGDDNSLSLCGAVSCITEQRSFIVVIDIHITHTYIRHLYIQLYCVHDRCVNVC